MLRVLKLNGFSRNGTDVVYFHHENRIRTHVYMQSTVCNGPRKRVRNYLIFLMTKLQHSVYRTDSTKS